MKIYITQNLLLDLLEIFRDNACRYKEHSWKFFLEKTNYKKGCVLCNN